MLGGIEQSMVLDRSPMSMPISSVLVQVSTLGSSVCSVRENSNSSRSRSSVANRPVCSLATTRRSARTRAVAAGSATGTLAAASGAAHGEHGARAPGVGRAAPAPPPRRRRCRRGRPSGRCARRGSCSRGCRWPRRPRSRSGRRGGAAGSCPRRGRGSGCPPGRTGWDTYS